MKRDMITCILTKPKKLRLTRPVRGRALAEPPHSYKQQGIAWVLLRAGSVPVTMLQSQKRCEMGEQMFLVLLKFVALQCLYMPEWWTAAVLMLG